MLYRTRTQAELARLTADLPAGAQHRAVPAERVAAQVAILSSTHARPTGYVEGRIAAVAVLGNARIDLAYAQLGSSGVQIFVQTIGGAVDIVVPPHARVSMSGFPLLGTFSPTREPGPADGPPVHVTAFALLGSVTSYRAEAPSGQPAAKAPEP